jgi:hypothetical protein
MSDVISTARKPSSAARLAMMVVLVGLALAGCVRVQVGMAVSGDDMVSGEVVLATIPGSPGDKGPRPEAPESLKSRVSSEAYDVQGYTGSKVRFNALSFDELKQLAAAMSGSPNQFSFGFRRTGNLVALSGQVDLTQVPKDRSDIKIKVTFPGPVTQVDAAGKNDGDTVEWAPKPGSVTQLSATAQSNQSGSPWFTWMWLVALGGAVVAGLVGWLAYYAHRRNARAASEG